MDWVEFGIGSLAVVGAAVIGLAGVLGARRAGVWVLNRAGDWLAEAYFRRWKRVAAAAMREEVIQMGFGEAVQWLESQRGMIRPSAHDLETAQALKAQNTALRVAGKITDQHFHDREVWRRVLERTYAGGPVSSGVSDDQLRAYRARRGMPVLSNSILSEWALKTLGQRDASWIKASWTKDAVRQHRPPQPVFWVDPEALTKP